ncbi:hypothetical protein Rhopal_006716-T1 [Rhodotorula paludigena]|uniref:Amino acid transporter transmembrane domain-containing protein n=1 Tax=Rhodotorula paludigena TaxID=86838 RepID=A0AAV5GUP6_9BASI|nr:hypothetical protein Rhopal_006716-T1 [Rhodotorula paludigena]
MGATIDSGSTKYSNADKDEFAHQTEVQRDLPSVEEGGEAPIVEDAVFGEQGGKDTLNYRTVGWGWSAIMMVKAQLGIGVLTIPSSFHSLGLIPGIIILLVIAVVTTWTDISLGIFKQRHPSVYSLSDCGRVAFGLPGSVLFAACTWLFQTFVAASAMLSVSTALNALSLHGACTAIFVVVALIIIFPVACVRRLNELKVLGWIGLATIVPAILLVTIAVAVGGRPASAPPTGPLDLDVQLFASPSFAEAMNAISNLVFSFAATPLYLPIACEMRNIRNYPKAIYVAQGFTTGFYLLIGIVVYWYAGQYVASPALGTAGTLYKRIGYGLALPGLLFSGIIYTHLAAKFIFLRVLRGTRHVTHGTRTHWTVWLGSCADIIASAIPVFSGLLGLVGALFGTTMCFNAEAAMWMWDFWGDFRRRETRTWALTAGMIGNALIVLVGLLLIVGGTYGSVLGIRDDYASAGGRPFSCADNSGSV